MPTEPWDLVQRGRGPTRTLIIYARCTPEEHAALKAAAARNRWTVADVIRSAIARYLAATEPSEPKPRKGAKHP